MEMTNLIVGLALIVVGFLVKSYPNLIAGYNTMTKEGKKKVDIKGLSSMMRNMLVVLGLVVIAGYYGLWSLGYEEAAGKVMPVAVPLFALIMVALSWKYYRRYYIEKKN